MEQLEWEKKLEFVRQNGLINEYYRLGQAVGLILEKKPESLSHAIKLLESEIERQTTIRK